MTNGVNISDRVHSPTVSVIIPTHNRGDILRRAIDSVLNQTYKDFELIVVSDGCTDNTDEIVTSYADPRIKFFSHEKSCGASAARNTGIKASTGQYIAFLDDDDEWTVDKLEVQVPVIERSAPKLGLVYAWMEYIEDGRVKCVRAPELRGDIFIEMLDKQAITNSSTLMIRREVLDVVKGFDESLLRGNDGDFIRRISKHFAVDYVPKVLAKINIGHEDRITVNNSKYINAEIFAFEKRLQYFKDDFDRHPCQKMAVYSKIVLSCSKCGKLKKGLNYFKGVLESDITTKQKVLLIYRIWKGAITFYLYKQIHFLPIRKQ